jgi:NADPH2:quinone reductase
MGTAAQFVVLPERQAVTLPEDVDFDAGACFGIPALTALHAVLGHGGVQGKDVLVAGGAGAVGHYAVQFARRLGARRVLASVSGAAKAQLVLQAGADAAIDRRSEDVAARVRELTADRGVDRVIEVDIAANARLDTQLLRRGGEAVVYGSGAGEITLPFFPLISENLSLHFFIVYHLGDEDRAQAQATLARLLREQPLLHNVAERLPLARIAEAHELVESGRAVGNVVLSLE